MSLTVGELQVLLSGDTRPFNRDLDSLDSRAGKTESIWSGAFKKIAVTGGAVLATLGVASFLNDTKKIGIEYTNQLNTLQAVSGATAQQMADVGKTAKVLGSDLTLPATSAADAAAAMTELAKGGLSVDEAMTAAKGTLQLAAAAQIDAAGAAQIQSSALNQFGLSAGDAGRVADVLAATANAAAGELTDVALALSYVGPVANTMGVSIEEAAGAIGVLANNGLIGEKAGTGLRAVMASLAAPSKQAAAALEDLGIQAFDAQGNFVGFSSIAGQLSDAQGRLTTEAFSSAAAIAFGNESLGAVNVLATEGAAGLDAMTDAAHRQGAAVDLSAAKSKGLGGAIEGLKSQVETFQIDLFERASPNLEKLVRFAAEKFPQVGEAMFDGMDAAVGYVKDFADTARDAFEAVADYVEPVTSQLDDLYDSLTATNGPLDAVWGGLKLTGGALIAVADALSPVVQLGGAVLGFFNSLPGPIQTAVLGLAALKVASSFDFFGKLAGKGGIAGGVASAGQSFVGFGQTVRANMALADESVGVVSRTTGGMVAAFETYMPRATGAVRNFRGELSSAFDQAKGLQQYKVGEMFGTGAIAKSTGDLAGFTAAAKTAATQGVGAMRSAAGGLVGFMGGPWGVALAAGAVMVGGITASMQKASAQTDEWAQALLNGGAAARKVADEAQAQRDKQPFEWMANLDEWAGFAPSMEDAAKSARELYDSMSPLEQKQQDVATATNELQDAIARWGADSGQAIGAAVGLRDAQSALADATDEVTEATKSQIDKLNEAANLQLAQVNSSLAAQQSQFALADQLAATNGVIAEQGAGSDAAARSLTDLAQQAISNAQAQGKAAADQAAANGVTDTATVANQAMLTSLQATAQQMGSNTPAAISQLIASLQASSGTAAVTSAQMADLGLKVTSIPNSKTIVIDAPTADQRARLEGLGYTVRTLPNGKVEVTANTGPAESAIQSLLATRHMTIIADAVPGSTVRAANAQNAFRQLGGAIGGIVHPYAQGGFEPMKGGIAQVVGPNTWRVIGDRVRDDEAYIPINQDARSLSILSQTARRMGGEFVPNGAVASGATTSTGSGSVVHKHYHLSTVVREVLTTDQIMRAVRQEEAIYG